MMINLLVGQHLLLKNLTGSESSIQTNNRSKEALINILPGHIYTMKHKL